MEFSDPRSVDRREETNEKMAKLKSEREELIISEREIENSFYSDNREYKIKNTKKIKKQKKIDIFSASENVLQDFILQEALAGLGRGDSREIVGDTGLRLKIGRFGLALSLNSVECNENLFSNEDNINNADDRKDTVARNSVTLDNDKSNHHAGGALEGNNEKEKVNGDIDSDCNDCNDCSGGGDNDNGSNSKNYYDHGKHVNDDEMNKLDDNSDIDLNTKSEISCDTESDKNDKKRTYSDNPYINSDYDAYVRFKANMLGEDVNNISTDSFDNENENENENEVNENENEENVKISGRMDEKEIVKTYEEIKSSEEASQIVKLIADEKVGKKEEEDKRGEEDRGKKDEQGKKEKETGAGKEEEREIRKMSIRNLAERGTSGIINGVHEVKNDEIVCKVKEKEGEKGVEKVEIGKDKKKNSQNDVEELILLQTNSEFQNVGSKIPLQNLSCSPQVNSINLENSKTLKIYSGIKVQIPLLKKTKMTEIRQILPLPPEKVFGIKGKSSEFASKNIIFSNIGRGLEKEKEKKRGQSEINIEKNELERRRSAGSDMSISLKTKEMNENEMGSVPIGSFFSDVKNIPPRTKKEVVIDMRMTSVALPSFSSLQPKRSFELDAKEFDRATEIAAKTDISSSN